MWFCLLFFLTFMNQCTSKLQEDLKFMKQVTDQSTFATRHFCMLARLTPRLNTEVTGNTGDLLADFR